MIMDKISIFITNYEAQSGEQNIEAMFPERIEGTT